jgi:hypothetical protein
MGGASIVNTGTMNVWAGNLAINAQYFGTSNAFGGSLFIATGAQATIDVYPFERLTTSISGAGSLSMWVDGIISPAGYNFSGTTTVSNSPTIAANNSFGSTGSLVDLGHITLAAGTGPTLSTKFISSLTINASSSFIVQPSNSSSSRTLLSLGSLSLLGTLDLGNNDMQVVGGSLSTIWTAVATGFANGTWNGSGLTSVTARNSSNHLLALGVIQNNQSGTPLFSASNPFDGITPGASDVLVKSTYYGDANLSGKVDSADYTLIDNGFLNHKTGWFNGDFNYDGTVNGSDYTLIDNAFNTQGAQISSQVASVNDQLAADNSTSIPEPGALGVVALVAGLFLRRRVAPGMHKIIPHGAPV